MHRSHIRVIQEKLTETGHYTGAIDGLRGAKTHAAVAAGIGTLGKGTPEGFSGWSEKRKTIAYLQAFAHAEGIDAGAIDGLWGPQTAFAADALEEKRSTGEITNFHDLGPVKTGNPHGFPDETRSQSALVAFYGQPGSNSFRPPLVKVPVPWTLKIAWNKSQLRSFLWVHEKCADSLKTVLARIDAAYSADQISDLGIDLFGGDYAPRKMRGANRHSLHGWGIAYDFDPERNQLKWNSARARLGQRDAVPFWEAWEAEGWCGLGRVRNYDFMHVQAAPRAY